ncbi:hypothetical protein Q1695_007797 [Nippostrongylus brasiliensis]|nr:hypothetical protein Q1695_007797 [Nippostrongylus brasiliensis]
MVRSLRSSQVVQTVVQVFRNYHVNFIVTACLIMVATYLTVLAAFGRNFIHPFTNDANTTTAAPVDSTSLITSAFSIFFLLMISLIVGKIFEYVSLPPLFGCLLVGLLVKNILVLNEIFDVNPRWEFCIRTLALTVILIRCGIGLSWEYLKEAMAVTLSLGILTAAVESGVIAVAAIFIFGWSVPMALICGFVLAAVSPAVTVPVMLDLQEQGLGTRKGIPSLVLASTTLDNIFCVTAFSVATTTVFSSEPLGEIIGTTIAQLVVGAIVGLVVGWILWWFPVSYVNNSSVCRTLLLLTIPSATVLGGSVLGFPSAGIIAASLMTFVAATRWRIDNDDKIVYEEKAFALLWKLFFMPLLFALIGMKLDFSVMTWSIVLTGCALIGIGVVFRFLSGIIFSCCSDFSAKEQLVVAMSLLPKATVQAALAPSIVAYAAGTGFEHEAHMAQTACILTILLTAPLGQYILSKTAPLLLQNSRVIGIAKSTVEDMEYGGKVINGGRICPLEDLCRITSLN